MLMETCSISQGTELHFCNKWSRWLVAVYQIVLSFINEEARLWKEHGIVSIRWLSCMETYSCGEACYPESIRTPHSWIWFIPYSRSATDLIIDGQHVLTKWLTHQYREPNWLFCRCRVEWMISCEMEKQRSVSKTGYLVEKSRKKGTRFLTKNVMTLSLYKCSV